MYCLRLASHLLVCLILFDEVTFISREIVFCLFRILNAGPSQVLSGMKKLHYWESILRGVARISGRGVLKIFPLLRLPLMRVRVYEWVGSLLSAALAHAKHCRIAVPTILSAG